MHEVWSWCYFVCLIGSISFQVIKPQKHTALKSFLEITVNEVPVQLLSISPNIQSLIFIQGDALSLTSSTEFNLRTSSSSPGTNKVKQTVSVRGLWKVCELFEVASSCGTQLFIRSKAGVIKQLTERDHPWSMGWSSSTCTDCCTPFNLRHLEKRDGICLYSAGCYHGDGGGKKK